MLIVMVVLSVFMQVSNDIFMCVGISRRYVGVVESFLEGWEGKNIINVVLIKIVGIIGKGCGQSELQKFIIVDFFGIFFLF